MNILFESWRTYLISENNMDTDQVSKAVLFNNKNKILFLKSALGNFKGEWDLPGGHIHRDEPPAKGLKREVKEETGLDIEKPIKLFKQGNITYYRASMPDSKISLSHEHTDYECFDIEKIREKDFKTSDKFKKAIEKAVEDRK
jgi:8-oxo-dGTP diphosphatase